MLDRVTNTVILEGEMRGETRRGGERSWRSWSLGGKLSSEQHMLALSESVKTHRDCQIMIAGFQY